MLFDNARYISRLIKRVYTALLTALLIMAFMALFFAKKWYDTVNRDNVYILSSDNTLMAGRVDGTLARSSHEITAFSKIFLEKAFSHNEYSWEANLTEVTELMDQESARIFLAKMDKNIEALYKERNAISTVALQDIEVNVETQPYEVLLYYTTTLQFASLGDVIYDNTEVAGGIYFQIVPLSRSKKNPFGMQIRKFKFLQKQSSK